MIPVRRTPLALGVIAAVLLAAARPAAAQAPSRLVLHDGWSLQSSEKAHESGEVLSRPGFDTTGWYAITVPNTVVGALVENGTYPDPYFGMNLRSLPGMTYPIAKNFELLPMSPDSPFARSWWYRKEFDLPAALGGRAAALHLDGVNYRANVWLNGHRLADASETAGAFRRHDLDITRWAHAGGRNALAVEVFAPTPTDLAVNWVDWNPMPPDKNMGLWGDVSVTDSGAIALRHPQVVTTLDLPSLDVAHLTVTTEAWNTTDRPVHGTLRGTIGDIRLDQAVDLAPREKKIVRFTPATTPALDVQKPRLWWPYRMGEPYLHTLALEAEADGALSDRAAVRFGMRQVTSELTEEGHRLFRVNGRKVLVRGGGWSSDMLLRRSSTRLRAEIQYVRDLGLNTIRSEGKFESDEFFDLADERGILVMIGWCCCDQWETWDKWDAEDRRVAVLSLADQTRRLRTHPSVFVWVNGSDGPPPPAVEKAYLDELERVDWARPVLSSAADKAAASGPSGVKMRGPYEYVPPSYWLLDAKNGGAFGFDTEVSPGAAVPPLETLKEILPPEHLWPIDAFWLFHAGGQEFASLKRFTAALEARYGPATGVADYARKAQALTYEGERAMFEAFARNKYKATGVIQWMLNNAWPSMIWHLYDHSLRPGGGFYGTKKACEPLHVQYSYDDRSVVVVNDRQEDAKGLKVAARVLDLALATRFSREAAIDVAADGVARAFEIPAALPGLGTTYFVRLDLTDAAGASVSTNFYWLSTRDDVLDFAKTEWFYTPVKRHADLTALAHLPATTLAVVPAFEPGAARVRVTNTGKALAFQVRLKLTDGAGGAEVLPAAWDDNYVALLPGEAREFRVSFAAGAVHGSPSVEVEAWNAPAVD
jgi:exo-1,4-beta-D-glucosaminidase